MGAYSLFGQLSGGRVPTHVVEMTSDRSDTFHMRRNAVPGPPRGGSASPFRFGRRPPPEPAPPRADAGRIPLPGQLVPWQHDPGQSWSEIPAAAPDPAAMRRNRIVAGDEDAPATAAFDILRTRLAQALEENRWRRIAVTSPTRGCGKTVVAANLALSFARRPGARVVLADLDLRRPGLAGVLGVPAPGPVEAALRGDVPMLGHLRRLGSNLALMLNDAPVADAAELLQDSRTADVLEAMAAALEPDVILYDLPPALGRDDVLAFLPQVDGVLVIADGTQTLPRDITACERSLEGRTQLFGVVLNRGEDGRQRRYAFGTG